MRKHLTWSLLAVLLAGCGSSGDENRSSEEAPNPNANVIAWHEGTKTTGGVAVVKLEGVTEISLGDLLNSPRSELAARGEECRQSIEYLERLHGEGHMPFHLLPGAYDSAVLPVFRQAKFSPQRGFSVPPYLLEGRPDTELALHLARYGDLEAARKLLDPADQDAARQLDGLALERNYPVEWSRLVGLLLRRSLYQVLMGNVDEAKQLIGLHEQLGKLFGPRARSSPLGVQLLSRGRSILYQAAGAWRANRQESLADQALAFADAWGETPGLTLAWQGALPRPRAERIFDAKSTGKALAAPSALRVLDLLGLAVPDYGLESAIGTLDSGNRLVETLLLYRTGDSEYYPRPEALTHVLSDCLNQPVKATTQTPPPEKLWQTVALGSLAVDIGVVPQNPAVSAMVRVRAVGENPPQTSGGYLPRDFGVVGLDRSFEQMRRHVALNQRSNPIKISSKQALDGVHSPITAPPPSRLTIERAEGFDVPTRLTVNFATRQKGRVALGALAGPLWALAGSAHISGGRGPRPLTLAWQDEQTGYVLRLPNRKDEEASLTVQARTKDSPPPTDGDWVDHPETDVAARAAVILTREREERRTRIEKGTPWARLPRDLEQIRLGMTKEEVQQVLPPDFKASKRSIPSGLLVTMTDPTPRGSTAAAREYGALFDEAGRVVEVWARYQSGSGPAALAKLEATLEKRGGAPETGPGPWAQSWADLPKRKPAPVLRRWQDDITLLTGQKDAHGIELRLRDCPLAHEEGAPAPALTYLPRGPEKCILGTAKDDLLRQWKVTKPVMANGAVVLAPKASSPFDALLVWFKDDRAVKVVARHKGKGSTSPAQAAATLTAAWGQEGRSLGIPLRQDFADGNALQGWTTQDDRTRVRIFWEQRNSDGIRVVFTEWRDMSW